MKRLRLLLLALGCAAAVQTAMLACGIVINTTPSLPKGFYRKVPRRVEKGSFVLFCLPDSTFPARPYAHENLIKKVLAEAGDRICIDAGGVRVNGWLLANSVPLPCDRDGRPLPGLRLADYTLKADELLTMSTYNPRSFDGRYFGPVPRKSVIAVVEPLFTW